MRNSPAGVAGLAHQLRQVLTPTPFTSGWIQWGKVGAVHTAPRSVDLYLDGATTLTLGIRYLGWWAPAVGETIPVLRGPKGLHTDRIALGPLSKAPVGASAISLFGLGTPASGTWATGLPFLIQSGSGSFTTNATDKVAIAFPNAFPTGVVSVMLQNIEGGTNNTSPLVAAGSITKTGFTVLVPGLASTAVSLSWLAIGF